METSTDMVINCLTLFHVLSHMLLELVKFSLPSEGFEAKGSTVHQGGPDYIIH